ncbi:hypothetical protein [Flavobacterium sp. ENC]|uniref:hypothetical protein n=1 Tax=Flavobacterium sp. ENC TaxID=2897330 RepID=UPI001E4B6424|nr:hypothetical protein [Flavobacterium sp. ENC]MCD0465968.1 hypothetical protein [Flavobacterium sp. ENC]
MEKLYYVLIFIFTFSAVSAQEKLSKEEKERRQKNIQAANPFAKYGYKAKVATLSNGKYLEVHDLDSIVTIGTIRWHVAKQQIVGTIKMDTLNMDLQPIGDAPGRWISMDPLSEEFSSWSPYNMCLDNPMKFVDPDGRAPLTDLFNLAGRKIGTDGVNNGVKVVITDNREARQISRIRGNVDLSTVNSGVILPTDAVLRESLNVLSRTVSNGGQREESSLVMNTGAVIRGQTGPMPTVVNGEQIAPSRLPALPLGTTPSDVAATIHSHPTTVAQEGNQIFPQSASFPSTGIGSDGPTFQQYNTNIIVGPIGTITNVTASPDGTLNIPNRTNGAAIYNSDSTRRVQLEKSAIERILTP